MMNFKRLYHKASHIILINIVFILNAGSGCSQENIPANIKFCDIYILNNQNQKIKLNVEIADTAEKQTRGLMYRDKLAANDGMLFVFNDEEMREFWMKNTFIPLNIAYINRQGTLNEIYYMRPIDTSVTYPSRQPAMYALEVNKDWFIKNNISEGSKVIFNGCLGK